MAPVEHGEFLYEGPISVPSIIGSHNIRSEPKGAHHFENNPHLPRPSLNDSLLCMDVALVDAYLEGPGVKSVRTFTPRIPAFVSSLTNLISGLAGQEASFAKH